MAQDFRDRGIPLLRLAGLKPGHSLLEGCNFLDACQVEAKWSQFRLRRDDVLLSTSASLGEVAVVDDEVAGAIPYTGIVAFRPADHRVNARFIPWLLRAPSFKAQIEMMGVGSVMKHFGPMHLRQMTVDFPDLRQQSAIAEVLGALDDKIAANRSLSSTERELADSLFSVHRQGSCLSEVTYRDVAEVGGGGTPSTKEPAYWDGDIPWATPTDVTALDAPYLADTGRHISAIGLAACASPLYKPGAILMTSRATIGAFALAGVPVAVNQGFIVVTPKDPRFDMWLFHEMQNRVDDYLSLANGATFLELSRGRFRDTPVWWASEEAMAGFGEEVRPLHAHAQRLASENAHLAHLRDTLLPLLMSGQLCVRDAERAVERVL